MVRELFGVTPDPWQDDVLAAFPTNQRIAMLASKGPGKTAVEAWLAWNYLLTRPHPNIAAVSVTAENLADNLWKEMAMWQGKSDLLQSAFEWRKTRIEYRDKPATWWMSARTWPRNGSRDEQANTLAGLHAPYVLFIMDESGGIPDSVLVSAEAALSTCTEGHIVQGGNPTHREGALYRAHQNRTRWLVFEVNGDPDNPKRSPRVDVEWARDQIAEYGRDNPWVLVNVFGQFPPSSIDTLIGEDEVLAAMRRSYTEHEISSHPRIMGVDVAAFGDDASVIWPRQGLVAFAPESLRNVDSVIGGGRVARKWDDWEADACFIDDTGGFGAGWISHLGLLGKSPIGVGFSSEPNDRRYFNKRAEIYFNACQWIRSGGQLPPIGTPGVPELMAALTRTTYSFRGDRLLLEPKDMVKQRLGYSPDHGDAFALSFSHPVAPRRERAGRRGGIQADYDPFAEMHNSPMVGRMTAHYDPMR